MSKHVVVIGGGIMGSFSAFWLKMMKPSLNVTVIERDHQYRGASTVLSAGGVRQQFSAPENIKLSQLTLEILRDTEKFLDVDKSQMQFVEEGYAILAATDEGSKILHENNVVQTNLGADISLHDAESLKSKFQWMNCEDITCAAVGNRDEGWFDPWSLLTSVRQKNKDLGIDYVSGDVNGMTVTDNFVKSVHVDNTNYECDYAVSAAGAFSQRIAKLAGVNIPVEARPRSIFAIHCPDTVDGPSQYCPLVVDPTGVWFRRESTRGSGMFLCGLSPYAHEDTNLHHDLSIEEILRDLEDFTKMDFFEERIWPVLAHRCSLFNNLKVRNAWSGLYDYNTLDQNAIIGAHPNVKNLFFCTGFSGHGLQQGPAAGRAISELIVNGKFVEIDLKAFSFDRILQNKGYFEKNIV